MTKTKMSDLLDDDQAPNQEQAEAPEQKPEIKKTAIKPSLPIPEEAPPVIDKDAPKMAQPTKAVRIPDLRGKRAAEHDTLYASIGISRDFLPRLTRRRTAIYQLVNWGKKMDKRYEGFDQYVDPPPYQLVPNYTFVDSKERDLTNREKTLTFYDGGNEIVYTTDPVTKKSIPNSIPKVGAPEFIGGQIIINIYNNYRQYVWFELHPRNATNKFRDRSVEPIFERIDIKFESPHVANIMEDLKLEAGALIQKMKPHELINLASAMTNPTIATNVDPQQLRLTLRIRAKENPNEILFKTPDSQGATKVLVVNALDFGIIAFVPEYEAYYYKDETEPCFRVPTGNDPFAAFVEYLSSSEGEDLLISLKDDLSFWF